MYFNLRGVFISGPHLQCHGLNELSEHNEDKPEQLLRTSGATHF